MECPTNQKELHRKAKSDGAFNLPPNLSCRKVLFSVKKGHQGRPLPEESGFKFTPTITEMNFMVHSRNVNAKLGSESRELITFAQPAPAQPIF
jgi:hypothetical protein